VNIPTGVPLVYTFDDDKKVLDKKYLIDNKELQKKQDLVISQGRV
jgi:2,3-bisphosphoglycerate-dependent phosphoglycerate mutase